jgi:hypothetical protein
VLAAAAAALTLVPAGQAGIRPDSNIAALQAALKARGLYAGPVDGLLGPKTTRAVRVYQRRRGLPVDGIPGPRTRASLGRWARHRLGSRMLRAGASGWDVAQLQFLLTRCGRPALGVDGRFGVRTGNVLRRYQLRAGLLADAVAGPATVASLRACAAGGGSKARSRIAPGVTIGGVRVGGLSASAAGRLVSRSFARPLRLVLGRRTWRADPRRLARPRIRPAVRRALAARRGAAVALTPALRPRALRAYVARLARARFRPAVSSRLVGLRSLRPYLTPSRAGRRLDRRLTARLIAGQLALGERRPVRLRTERVAPTPFGPIVVVRRRSHRLFFYRGTKRRRVFVIATGAARTPTPLGRFTIVWKDRNPWWFPPKKPWAAGLEPIPPGPGNPLGTRWMGLSSPGIGIHGAPDPTSLGYSVSHGCVRMRIREAEWLFRRVRVGTAVFVVNA